MSADKGDSVEVSLPVFAIYLFIINAATYVAFWIDKSRAQQGGYRISESTLLTLSFLGGSPASDTLNKGAICNIVSSRLNCGTPSIIALLAL